MYGIVEPCKESFDSLIEWKLDFMQVLFSKAAQDIRQLTLYLLGLSTDNRHSDGIPGRNFLKSKIRKKISRSENLKKYPAWKDFEACKCVLLQTSISRMWHLIRVSTFCLGKIIFSGIIRV